MCIGVLQGGNPPTRSLHTGPMSPPQRAWPFPMRSRAALEHHGVVLGQGHAPGPVQSPGVGRALPALWGFHGTWALGLTSFLSSLSERAVSTRSTTETFIEKSAQDPSLQLTTRLGRGVQPRQRGSRPLPTRWALTLPTWGSPVAPCVPQSTHRETRALVSLGETCPRLRCSHGGKAGYAIPACSSAGGRRKQSSTGH